MHTTAGNTDGNESVSNLPHDDSPVCASTDSSADGSEFGFPVRPDLVFIEWGDEGDERGKRAGPTCCDDVGTIVAEALSTALVSARGAGGTLRRAEGVGPGGRGLGEGGRM